MPDQTRYADLEALKIFKEEYDIKIDEKLNEKINISQGSENAGKILTIDETGNTVLASQTQADWDVTDESNAGFIQNKPFGETIDFVPIVENEVTTDTTYKISGFFSGDEELYAKAPFKFVYNDVEYILTKEECTNEDGHVSIGVAFGSDKVEGFPFSLSQYKAYLYITVPNVGDVISVYYSDTIVAFLDEKYLPKHNHAWAEIEGKPFQTKISDTINTLIFSCNNIENANTWYSVSTGISIVGDAIRVNINGNTYAFSIEWQTNDYGVEYFELEIETLTLSISSWGSITYLSTEAGIGFSIYGHGEVVECLDEKYIPSTIARVSDLPTIDSEISDESENPVQNKVIAEKINEIESSIMQSDWTVNDIASTSYIKNRPFYTTDPQPVELCNGTFEFNNSSSIVDNPSAFYESSAISYDKSELVVNKEITIAYDGTTYNNLIITEAIVEYNGQTMPPVLYAGNGAILAEYFTTMFSGMTVSLDDTGEPFVLSLLNGSSVIITKDKASTHDISISVVKPVDITISQKYLGFPVWAGEGKNSIIIGDENGVASGEYTVCEGKNTKATGNYSHVEGWGSEASGGSSHAEGYSTDAIGQRSHAECSMTIASGYCSHAEGHATVASGKYSHAEGQGTISSGDSSHTEGSNTKAMGNYSHAEGYGYDSTNESLTVSLTGEARATTFSISEDIDERYKDMLLGNDYPGQDNPIIDCTIVDNKITEITFEKFVSTRALSNQKTQLSLNYLIAKGEASHAEGIGTMAYGNYQHTQGKYNVVDNESVYAHIVGNGTADSARSNAHTLDWQGNAWYQGSVEATAIILKSPNGTRFSITVGDDGVLSATEITE